MLPDGARTVFGGGRLPREIRTILAGENSQQCILAYIGTNTGQNVANCVVIDVGAAPGDRVSLQNRVD